MNCFIQILDVRFHVRYLLGLAISALYSSLLVPYLLITQPLPLSSDIPTLGMKRSHLGNQIVPVMGTKKPTTGWAVDFFLSYCRLDYFRPSLVFT
jgi:hypothetical protein